MSYNGSGTFTLVAGNPVVTGTTISSTWANNTLNDIATGLSTAITKDGQTTPTANIPMGGYKITGLGAATVAGDALRFENIALIGSSIQAQTYEYFTTGGTTTAYTLTPTPALTGLVAGQRFNVVFNAANTTASTTLAISGLTAKTLKVYSSAGVKTDPAIGALATNMISDVVYDGTDYVVLNRLQTMATARLLGRTTAATGAVEEISVAGGLSLAAGVLSTPDSSIQFNTSNGYGSSSSSIRLFTNTAEQRGSYATDYTVVHSATLGTVITINTADYYTFAYSESVSASQVFGLSINSTQLTTQLLNITLADRLIGGACENTSGCGFCGGRFYIPAGSVIRPHTNAIGGGAAAFCQLRIARG